MSRRIRSTTIALFFCILAAPFVQRRLRLFHYDPVSEFRSKNPRPVDYASMLAPGNAFSRKYEEYFNDSYGFRDLLIRLKNQIDYSVFNRSDRIVLGKDGWLFYKSVVEEEQVYLEQHPPEDIDRLFRRLLGLNEALKAKGVVLIVVPAPLKDTIYPELVPGSTARRPHPTAFQRYRAFLKEHPEIVTIDAQSTLERLKTSFPVFHKTDFHWNDVAGFYLARELIDRMAELTGSAALWELPLEAARESFKDGGENRSLALLWPIVENGLSLKSPGGRWQAGVWTRSSNPNQWEYRTNVPGERRLLPGTVLFGDSFADAFVRADFYVYFSSLQKFSNFDLKQNFRGSIVGSRFLILEHIEDHLNVMLQDLFWPDEVTSSEIVK